MFESLVITLREGIEAAIVVGIILTYLNSTGKSYLKSQVYRGLGVAIAASFAFAGVLQTLGVDPENEYFEGAAMGIAGILVASLVVWMWRSARNIKQVTEKKLDGVVNQQRARSRGWGLFVFTFVMVFREGAETVLFLISATIGQFGMFTLVGGMLGIALAVLFALLFVRGSLRINLSRFFGLTSVVLLLLAVKLILGSIHEFAEVGLLPMSKQAMAVIGYFVRGNTSTLILMVLLAVPLIGVLWGAHSALSDAATADTAAARRKILAMKQQERIWRLGLIGAAGFIFVAMGATVFASDSYDDPEPAAVTASAGQVKVPLASLVTGKMAKFIYGYNGTGIRFIVLRLEDDSLAVALDACQICGPAGYGHDGENAICKNCNAPIPPETIGQGGGCNPLPLAFKVDPGNVTIAAADLAKAEGNFK